MKLLLITVSSVAFAATIAAPFFAPPPPGVSDWGQFQADAARTGANGLAVELSGSSLTNASYGSGDPMATPVLQRVSTSGEWKGWVLHGQLDGTLKGYSYNSPGTSWTDPDLGDAIRTTPGVSMMTGYFDDVFVGTDDGHLYWLNPTGGTRTYVDVDSPIRGAIAVLPEELLQIGESAHPAVYFTCADGSVHKYAAKYDGSTPVLEPKWSNGTSTESEIQGISVPSQVTSEYCFVVDANNEVFALNQIDGTEEWGTVLGTGDFLSARLPVFDNDQVYCWYGGYVKALDIDDGSVVWTEQVLDQEEEEENLIIGALVDGESLVLTTVVGFKRLATSDGDVEGSRIPVPLFSYPVKMSNGEYAGQGESGSTAKLYSWDGVNWASLTTRNLSANGATRAIVMVSGEYPTSTDTNDDSFIAWLDSGDLVRVREP